MDEYQRTGSGGQSTISNAMDQAKQSAKEAAGQAKGFVRRQWDTRNSDWGNKIRSVAEDCRSASEHMRDRGNDMGANLIETVAERAERLSQYVKEADSEQILDDIENFGRSQPWAVATVGLLLGFAASRLIKTSSSRRYSQRYENGDKSNSGSYGGRDATEYASEYSPVLADEGPMTAYGSP